MANGKSNLLAIICELSNDEIRKLWNYGNSFEFFFWGVRKISGGRSLITDKLI